MRVQPASWGGAGAVRGLVVVWGVPDEDLHRKVLENHGKEATVTEERESIGFLRKPPFSEAERQKETSHSPREAGCARAAI